MYRATFPFRAFIHDVWDLCNHGAWAYVQDVPVSFSGGLLCSVNII